MKKLLVSACLFSVLSIQPLHSEAASYSKKIKQDFTIYDQAKKKYTVSMRSSKASCHKATSNDIWWIKGKDELCSGKFVLYLNGKSTNYKYTYTKSNPYVFSTTDAKTSAVLKNKTGYSTVFSLTNKETYSFLNLKTYTVLNKKLTKQSNTLTSYAIKPKMNGNLVQAPIYDNGGYGFGYVFNDLTVSGTKWIDERSHDYISQDPNSKRYKNGVSEMKKYQNSLSYFVK